MNPRSNWIETIERARAKQARARAISQRVNALSCKPDQEDQLRLLLPARVSMDALRGGRAIIDDLHNITALLNTALVLANDVGEHEAQAAIQDGILAIVEVKDRKTTRFAMNAQQRERIAPAVDLADELFCCCSLLEIVNAHTKLMSWLPKNGSLDLVEVNAED